MLRRIARRIARRIGVYAAVAASIPKIYLAYGMWFWASTVFNVIAITIFVYFWRAVYADTGAIAGLDLQRTLTYILLAQIFSPLAEINMIFEFGYNLREGGIAHVLLRPLDIQGSFLVQQYAALFTQLIMQIPLTIVVVLVFGLRFPSDPAVWAAFILSALLGRAVLFFFDYILASLTFYTTEVWGLGVLVFGIGLFFAGNLIPLAMLPGALQTLAVNTPFAQALYVPVSLLSGVAPLADAPRLWLAQAAWLVSLLLLSRAVFNIAVRKVTVQGG
jgi:ABC-2 type transport system permease protein